MEQIIKEFNRKMNKAMFICLGVFVFGVVGLILLSCFPDKKPANNIYQLECYPKYFILKDGDRTVDTIPLSSAGQMDSLILKDNQ